MTEEPQEAALQRAEMRHTVFMSSGCCAQSRYLSETEVEVSLQGAPLGGNDLVEDGGQQEGQAHSQSYEEDTCQTPLGVVAVMLTLQLGILLPEQQHPLGSDSVIALVRSYLILCPVYKVAV